ncbi:Glucanosyltransferase-domain-containing protein [Aspergillus granulosus]|uniref:1,3-beta-glucanosyltransferase n=1 Tax=Aspergillus granulosus TaxID=176169 RepID=A0ABR4H916_9EURO
MRLLGDAGIYVITYLNPLNGLASGNVTWTTEDFTAQTTIIDAFAGFDNVLAFFVQIGDSGPTTGVNTAVDDTARTGNELLSAYARAVVRDMKAYIASRVNQRGKDAETGYRQVPVGYAAYATDLLDDEVTFFTCGYKEERVDIFGIRSESWCGGSGFRSSGWENLTNRFEDSNVPVVMAEYYCGDPDRRDEDLNDVDKLYDEDMVEVWSGGMFYTYAGQDYGTLLPHTTWSGTGPLTASRPRRDRRLWGGDKVLCLRHVLLHPLVLQPLPYKLNFLLRWHHFVSHGQPILPRTTPTAGQTILRLHPPQ